MLDRIEAREARIRKAGQMLNDMLPTLYELNPHLALAAAYLVSCHNYARDDAFPESIRDWLIARWDCHHLIEE